MRKDFADTRNISAVIAKAGVAQRPPAALGRGTVRKDLAVTENTLISAVLARAGVSQRPPVALGRTSWLDVHVQTVGQLSAALRAEAAPKRGAALGRTSLLDLQTVGQQLSAALRGKAEPQPPPPPYSSPQRSALSAWHVSGPNTTTIGGIDVPVQQEQTNWARLKQQQTDLERLNDWEKLLATIRSKQPEKKELHPKLAALQAMIDAILAAMDRALLRFDLITHAVLFIILMRLRDEYNRELARLGTAYEPAHETAQERGR